MSVDEIPRVDPLPAAFVGRPIRIRVMHTMNGPIFGAKCRACNMYFAYMADLDNAFSSAEMHIARHKYELEVVEEGLAFNA